MTASIKILTTSTVDSSPSILLISPNGKRILVNCGEGCQRCFLESPTDKVRAVNQICLTSIGHATTGGLPGLILTSADAAESNSILKKKVDALVRNNKSENKSNENEDEEEKDVEPQLKKSRLRVSGSGNGLSTSPSSSSSNNGSGRLQIIGPNGTQTFIHSLRHFIRRDNFHISVHEGMFLSKAQAGDGVCNSSKRRKGKGEGVKGKKQNQQHLEQSSNGQNNINTEEDKGIFGIESIPMKRKIKTLRSTLSHEQTQAGDDDDHDVIDISSFLFTTSPIPGKFQIDKAKKLRIPPGKMYAKLKSGEPVTFKLDGEEEEVTIQPSQVLEGGSDGIATAILYCPDEYVMDQICCCDYNDPNNPLQSLHKFKLPSSNNNDDLHHGKKLDNIKMEVMIHIIPNDLFDSSKYQNFLHEFDHGIQHIAIYLMADQSFHGGNDSIDGSPFKSAVLGAMTRNLIYDDIYLSPFAKCNNCTVDEAVSKNSVDTINMDSKGPNAQEQLKVVQARAQMEYNIIPLCKRGLNLDLVKHINGENGIGKPEHEEMQMLVKESGAFDKAKNAIESSQSYNLKNQNNHKDGHIIFTGTGSAIPCKHRNVTGMYVEMKNGNGMLLDVGEGTIGQLIRCWKSQIPDSINVTEYIRTKLLSIKAVWISHPHADHHLGIIRFISERNGLLNLYKQSGRTMQMDDHHIIIMAPTSLINFLNEYAQIDPSIGDGFIAVDCKDTLLNKTNPMESKLLKNLGIDKCISVPVSHCWNSYALVVDCTSFGRIVYSGDCRPSDRLIDIGSNADILIHEATFEDGMEEEAVLKRHSTVGEAICVGKRMKANNVILTHFSQRYPRIPPLQKEGDSAEFPIAIAFDFMKVSPKNISIASRLTASLRLLYPASDEAFSLEIDPTEPRASETLSIPGAFAINNSCL